MGYQYAKKTSRSKNLVNAEVPKKRKYISSSIHQNRIKVVQIHQVHWRNHSVIAQAKRAVYQYQQISAGCRCEFHYPRENNRKTKAGKRVEIFATS